jgi:CheY-like chemotaxis protein
MLGDKPSDSGMYLKALIVEDDPILQVVHQKILRSLFIDSIIAGTGVEALQALQNIQFDFILMDINMPEQDGLDASRWIREEREQRKRDILIFALTSFTGREHTQEIMQAGINEHLKKPLARDELKKLLEKYFWAREAK